MRWTIKPKPSEDKIKHLAQALNVERFCGYLLVQRGIETLKTLRTSFVLQTTCTIVPDEDMEKRWLALN
jgi:hypothetical protein